MAVRGRGPAPGALRAAATGPQDLTEEHRAGRPADEHDGEEPAAAAAYQRGERQRGAQGGGTDECGQPVGEAAHHAEGDQHGGEERAVREAQARRTRRPRRRRSRTWPVANGARVRSTHHRRRSAARPARRARAHGLGIEVCRDGEHEDGDDRAHCREGSHRIGGGGDAVTVGRGWIITVTTLRPVPAPGIRPATYLAGAPPNVPIVARWQISTTPSRCGRTDPTAGWHSPTPTTSRSAACSAAGPPPSCWAPSSGPPRNGHPLSAHRQLPRASCPVVTSPSPAPPGRRAVDRALAGRRVAARPRRLLASALVVLANRRPTDEHCQWTMPDAAEPDTLERGRRRAPRASRR